MEGAHDDPVHASLHTRVSRTSRAPLPHTVSPFTVRTVIEAHAVLYMWVLARRRSIGRRNFVPTEVNGEKSACRLMLQIMASGEECGRCVRGI